MSLKQLMMHCKESVESSVREDISRVSVFIGIQPLEELIEGVAALVKIPVAHAHIIFEREDKYSICMCCSGRRIRTDILLSHITSEFTVDLTFCHRCIRRNIVHVKPSAIEHDDDIPACTVHFLPGELRRYVLPVEGLGDLRIPDIIMHCLRGDIDRTFHSRTFASRHQFHARHHPSRYHYTIRHGAAGPEHL